MPTKVTEHVCEIRFKPNARVLDYRGQWAELIAEHMNASEWHIRENRLDVFDKSEARRFFLAFRNCGVTIRDAATGTYFLDHAGRFLQYALSFDPIQKPVVVERLGVRLRSFRSFDGTFDTLLMRYTSRVLTLTPGAAEVLGGNLLDIGGNLNFSDDVGTYHTMSGPMKAEQAKKFLERDEAYEFPNVGVFMDCDYWSKPAQPMTVGEIINTVRRFADRAERRVGAVFDMLAPADGAGDGHRR